MFLDHDTADTQVVFKEDPTQTGEYTDEVTLYLWLAGGYNAIDGYTYIFYDINGYEWQIPASHIGTDKEYDWLKKCYPRVMAGYQRRLG